MATIEDGAERSGRVTLIAGGSGLLGPYLKEAASRLGPVMTFGRTGGDLQCDASDPHAVRSLIQSAGPGLIINCIALTDVDACEAAPEAADLLNRQVVANIAAAVPEDAVLMQISTDQVYSGNDGPHQEGSEAPVNVYGRSKLAGEGAALAHPNCAVLRTNFFGASRTQGRKSLSDWMIETFRAERPMTLFNDSFFSPLHMASLAAIAIDAVAAGLRGVFNAGSRNGLSKADFGLAVARRLGLPVTNADVGPARSVPGRAPRPQDMRMAVGKIEFALGRAMPTLMDEITLLDPEAMGETP